MKINLAPRIGSVKFWLTLVPAVTLLVQTIGTPFGYQWDFVVLNQELADIINAAFALLTVVGVVIDPTTPGVSDSDQAQQYGPLIETKAAQIQSLTAEVEELKAKQAAGASVSAKELTEALVKEQRANVRIRGVDLPSTSTIKIDSGVHGDGNS